MFQYTTETIINSNTGNLPDGKRFLDAGEFIVIDGVNTFKKDCINALYKSPFREEVKAECELTIPAVTAGDVLSLTIVLSERGNVRSAIQNAYLHNTKPFHYEVEVATTDDEETVAAKFVKLIKKDIAMTDFKFFTAAVDATDADKVVLKAKDCYIQFDSVTLSVVVETGTGYAIATKNTVAEGVVTKCGDEGAGTVTRLVKNLRIPTNASINPFGADQGGRPVPGGKYDQYLIEYKTERRHVAGVVVGSVDTSITSHVFFINKETTGLTNAWEALFSGISITAAGKTPAEDVEDEDERLAVVDGETTLKAKTEMGSVE